jgi:hypothetical protein
MTAMATDGTIIREATRVKRRLEYILAASLATSACMRGSLAQLPECLDECVEALHKAIENQNRRVVCWEIHFDERYQGAEDSSCSYGSAGCLDKNSRRLDEIRIISILCKRALYIFRHGVRQ